MTARQVSVALDGTITVRVGKVELGQGIVTALAQIAADELDADLAHVTMLPANTADGPDEGMTAGSMSVAESGAALRSACAEVRMLFLAEAARRLGEEPGRVVVRDGVFSSADGARRTSYGELADGVDLDRRAEGVALPKDAARLRIVGTDVPRLDLPDKIRGVPRFIHDLVLDGQLYGRVVRPPSPAASLIEVGTARIRECAGVVSVVVDGSFLGVVADDEAAADRAAAMLRDAAHWKEQDSLPNENDLPAFLRSVPSETFTVVDEFDDAATAAPVAKTLAASYSRPYLAHASMGPSCGVARWDGDSVQIWSHSQGIFPLKRAVAKALQLDPDRVSVQHVEGAGAYGHNGADDAAFDAVLLARSVTGRPVHVRWSRSDELTWSPFGSAMVVDLEAGLDAAGRVVSWSCDVWSQGHLARPGTADGAPGLLAAAHLARPIPLPVAVDPPASRGAGSTRGAVPQYDFPRRRITGHRSLRAPLRTSSLRGLGSFATVFAIESFMDELAAAAGRDPLEYRMSQLSDPRAREALETAARLGGWEDRTQDPEGVGRGIGFARYKGTGAYCAVVAEIEAVNEVRVRRLSLAVDVGRIVNPDGVRNQIEGGAVQAASWTLIERVRFDRRRVTSVDWESYPILRFSQVPEVDVTLVSRPDEPSVGAGEAAQGPTAAALGNALAAALGVRVRDMPMTTERIVSVLES
ncbi:MAG TPA: molybdopterin cofactor-binding domain-containing protein [Actinocrinis sp.]|uniref:xanthine dehydrogenase family protein molybdopterin-binding subunit n=1 Tax=Actinocrinis sp. TaxID=1920516 RepID=UPI002DDD93ED|nr:molybdopterin cofactor-binding domain-containing protein [Actinocrinis sp.]HEV3173254.1 molybdopterin cofactor-binding domain-containing protein [Actinocrinis sp.]